MNASAMLGKWSSFESRTRFGIIGAFIIVVALSLTMSVLGHPNRSVLFAAPLRPEQLSEVEERLAEWNVAFTPSADNVAVDMKRRNELLLRLSLAGVPHAHIDGSGDLLSKVGALTPQSVVDAQTRDGLAGDIELGLRGIAGIDDARVIIAPAKQGYFADEPSHAATASVRLRLHEGATLSNDAVSGIRAFVSASVAGLDTSHVTIVDDRGVALGADMSDEDGTQLQRSLQSALDAAIGAGASIVRVRVEYDNRRQTLHDVRRAPLGALTVTNNGERYTGEGKHYERSSQEADHGSDTRELTSETAGGRIVRISAAVFVDAQRAASVPAVRALAAATLGLVPARGDTLSVEAMNLQPMSVAGKDSWWPLYGVLVNVLPAIVIIAGVLLLARLAGKPLVSALSSIAARVTLPTIERKSAPYSPAEVRGALQHEPAHTAAAILSALPASTVAAVLEMYPPHERDAIIRRMQRPASPLVPDPETFFAKA